MRKLIFVFLAILLLLMAACTAEPDNIENEEGDTAADQEIGLQKVIIVVAMENYQPKELWPVYDTLQSEGFDITVAGSQEGTAKSGADSIDIDSAFSEISAEDYSGIIVIGGPGVKKLWDNSELHALISNIFGNGGVAAAICLAPLTLANAGVLKDGSSACWYNDSDIDSSMSELGVSDSGQDVTVNERVVTGNGPGAAQEFADKVVEELKTL